MGNYTIDKNKAKQFIINFVGILLGVFLFFKSMKYVAPFLIALILSIILEPFIRFLVKQLRFPRKLASITSVILVLLSISLIISSIVSKLVAEAKDLLEILPTLLNDAYYSIINLQNNNQFIEFPKEVTTFIVDQLALIVSYAITFANNMVKYLFNTAISLPSMLIFLLITIISTYFFLGDKERFTQGIKHQLPDNWYNKIIFIKTDILSSILNLFRAYMMIMMVTFSELLLGFTLMGVKYALFLAAIIAVLDILPIIGTGGVVIPWAIYSFIVKDVRMGVSLLILYVVILVVRQILEPKIVGSQIGVHPLLTLTSMYIGLKVLGASGLILGPITLLIVKSIFSVVFKGQNLKELLFKYS